MSRLSRLSRLQGMTEMGVVGIALPVLQALDFMHQLSLMHRDVKVIGPPYLCPPPLSSPLRLSVPRPHSD